MSNIVDSSLAAQAEAFALESFLTDKNKDSLRYAFAKKFTVHAGRGGQVLPKADLPAQYIDRLEAVSSPMALYLHFPFCKSKCLYCGFAGKQPDSAVSHAYTTALLREIAYLSQIPSVSRQPVRCVYFGGGTPTSMPPADLARLLESIGAHFKLANDCEITLEGRASDLVHAHDFVRAGFNRFSIGVQSFATDIRKRLGRIGGREETIKLLDKLIGSQMAAVIIDLIYGLPGQGVDDFIKDIMLAEKLGVDGLDTYQLNVFPNSALSQAIEQGTVPHTAHLHEQGAYYKAAFEYMSKNHWRQLSISHYGRTWRERNLYNPWVKGKNNCLGIGAGAGGCLEGWDTYRIPVVEKYMAMAHNDMFFPDILKRPDARQKISARIVAQIEKGVCHYGKLIEDFNLKTEPLFSVLKNWEESGLITTGKDWFELTVSGKFWGVNISQALITILEPN